MARRYYVRDPTRRYQFDPTVARVTRAVFETQRSTFNLQLATLILCCRDTILQCGAGLRRSLPGPCSRERSLRPQWMPGSLARRLVEALRVWDRCRCPKCL